MEYYNPLTQIWSSVSPLPTAIFYPEASACGSVIYVLGSEVEITDSFNPSLDCFFSYDAQTDQWSRLLAEFGQFFHATLVKAVSIHHTLHLCDLSTYKVSQRPRDELPAGTLQRERIGLQCLSFSLLFRSTASVRRPAYGKV